jgi:retinol dehydrogenase-12
MGASLAEESLLVRVGGYLAPLICVPVSIGVMNHLWAATSPDLVSGTYYEPVGVAGKETAVARDEKLSRELQKWTDDELRGFDKLV